MSNKVLTGLRYTIPQRELKHLGYKMLHNKRGYILEIEQWACTIWIWLAGKTVYVNDWYDRSYDVIEFYKANRDDVRFKDDEFLPIMFDRKSGDIVVNTRHEELMEISNKFFNAKLLKVYDDKYAKYKKYDDVYLKKSNMDKLIIEIDKLKPNQIHVGIPI